MLNWVKRFFQREEESQLFCSAIVPAAGSSSRMGGENKLFATIGGVPVLARTLLALSQSEQIGEIVVAAREEDLLTVADLCRAYDITKPMKVVIGGASRAESVMCALQECAPNATLVAIHDAARPLVTREVIDAAIEKAETCYAAAPAVCVKDTIKIAENGVVKATPDRSTLFAVQTPQVFDRDLLTGALRAALDRGMPITDDCSAVELLGKEVYLTQGSYENIKITTPEDLPVAEAIWENRSEG